LILSVLFRNIIIKKPRKQDLTKMNKNLSKTKRQSLLFPHKNRLVKTPDSLEAVANTLLATFKADGCLLYIFNQQINRLELATASGIKSHEIKTSSFTPGKGVCGSIFNEQKVICANDVKHDNQFNNTSQPELILDNYKMIAAPLMLEEKCLGVIEIINRSSSRDFISQDTNKLKNISNNIALLVKNEQLFDHCSYKLYQRNTLLDLAKEVNSARDLPDLLNFIVVTAAELLDSEASSLLLRKDDVLRFEIAYGEKGTEVKKFEVPIGAGVAGSVVLSGKSTFINQAEVKDSGIFKKIDKGSGFTTRNLIASPLQVKDHIIGVVEVLNRRNNEDYDNEDISLLESFANVAAITIERAQLIEKRIQAERLATIGRTVAGLAHCIKNITNALKGGEYIVDKGLRDNNPDLLKKGWEITKQGSARIRDLVFDMLTISKKREPEYSKCYPHKIVTEIVEILDEKVKEKRAKITTQYDETIGQVKIDKKNIFRCLLNLTSNALDACQSSKGEIKIETFKKKGKPLFGYRVIDNGHGISEENQNKLFKEFFSTKGSQGTGLGLSVTQSIIREHGGSIKCDSTQGKGTTFTIELPTGK